MLPQSETKLRTMVSNTGCTSVGELEIIPNISVVAVCCSRASASSRVRALTCSCRLEVELATRAAVGAFLRLGFVVLPCCGFAALRLIVRHRLTEPCLGPATIHYHIMRSVVHHSKISCRWAA